MDLNTFLQIIISGLLMGFVLSLCAVGLALIWGLMEILNFAHGDFLMVAMFSSLLLLTNLGIDPVFSLPITVMILFGIGLLTFRLVVRPVVGYPGIAALLVTFGLSVFIRNLVLFVLGPDFRMIDQSILAGKRIEFWNLHFNFPQLMASLGCVLVTFFIYLFISKSKFGRALRATALDKETALLMGINTNRVFALTFALGSACVGVAGGLMVNFYYVFPEVGFSFSILSFIIVGLGGFGNIGGAFLAGLLVALVEHFGGFLVGTDFKITCVFVLYLAVISLRPKGLFGW